MTGNTFPASNREWFWRVFHLSWPIILSGLSVPLVGLVDTAVMGQLPEPRYMAAVAVGAVIFSSVFWVFGFLRMGTTGFMAQAAGRQDGVGGSLVVLRAGLLAIVLGLLVIVLQQPLGSIALWLMGASADVTASAQTYFSIRVWSAPATFINYVVLGCLIGLQRTRAALFVQLVLNVSNMLLDVWFVLGLGWDVAGVAWASLLSELLALAVGLWLLRHVVFAAFQPAEHSVQLRESSGEQVGKGSRQALLNRILDKQALMRLFSVNSDLFLRTLLLTAGFFFFTSQGAQFGTVVLAANSILMNMFSLLAYGLDGFAHAAEALVGGAFGAGNKQAFKRAVYSSTLLAFITAVVISVLYAFFGGWIIRAITDIPEVVTVAYEYLPWLVVMPLLSVWSFQLDGIFVGTMQTRDMRNTVAAALLIYVLLVWLTVPLWGNHALWACMTLFLLLRGVFLWLLYPRVLRNMHEMIV